MIASTDYKEKKKQDYMNSFQTRFAQTFYKITGYYYMRDKIPSFIIIKLKVNMKMCQYFVEIMICLPFCLKKLNLLKSGLHKDNLSLFLFFLFKIFCINLSNHIIDMEILVMKRFYYVDTYMCMYFYKLYKVLLHNKTVDS